ncbi:ROK family protein [Neobacillus vireti]|uniref:ROK family protein n=1 Tax=Neobacillus vireti TaxID=220686 RepID=UPI0030006490
MLFGGIEAGGTKFVCAVGDRDGNIMERIQIPTTKPTETIGKVHDFFKEFKLNAIGLGSFGPIDINPLSDTYGYITSTPKQEWRNFPFVNTLKELFQVPIRFTTDVNAAALGESIVGAAKGLDSCFYMTIGTGIGAGAVVQGKILEGVTHPEMGHILVRRHPEDHFKGNCLYHSDCFEGIAAGPAIEARWGEKGNKLAENEEVWKLEGYYIAQALMNYILILSPKKIILGGGVMNQKQIFTHVHFYLNQLLNDYVSLPEILENYIVSPGLNDRSGIVGSLILAIQAIEEIK